MTTPDPVAVLEAGATRNGMTYGISPDLARHVLAVLDAAGFAVVALPPVEKERVSGTGVRSAWFGPIEACIYPKGGWTISDLSGHWDGDEEDDAEQAAAGIIAARRWIRSEVGK